MFHRFFSPALNPAEREVHLPPDESSHLTRVLRLGPGDVVAVFDGRGTEFRARVARVARDGVTLSLEAQLTPAAEPVVRLALAQAVLKGEAMDEVVRDATMMGVSRIDPLLTDHVAVKPRIVTAGHAVERWQRIAVASAKQCRRATVPVVSPPRPFDEWRARSEDDWRLMLVEPAAVQGGESDMRSLAGRPRPASAALLVGPEGGWSAEERTRAASSGCVPVSLGGLTLRADAIPVAAIAVLRYVLEDL
jgi:16S rRNA (uracil1498-N3)-methyltransferase